MNRAMVVEAFKDLPQRHQVQAMREMALSLSGLSDPSTYLFDLAYNAAQDEEFPGADPVETAERYMGECSTFGMVR